MNPDQARVATLLTRRQTLLLTHATAIEAAQERIAAEEREIVALNTRLAEEVARLGDEAIDMLADLARLDERPPEAAKAQPEPARRARTKKDATPPKVTE